MHAPFPATMCFRLLAIAWLALAPASLAAAQSPETYSREDLRRAEAARDEALARLARLEKSARSSEREAVEIDADLIVAAAESRRREEAATAAERRLADLAVEMEAAREALSGDEAALEDLTAALMMLSARRPPALAVNPDDIGAAIRSAILMGELTPSLAARAEELRGRLETLGRIREDTQRQQAELAESEQALTARREEIAALSQEKRMTRSSYAAETSALRTETLRLAREAQDIRALLDGLERSAPTPPRPKPQSNRESIDAALRQIPVRPGASLPLDSRTGAVQPVLGEASVRFGQSVGGQRHPGLTLATRAGAQVVSPVDARIEFAGLFRSYGQMLILDVGDDMLVIVSGLDEIYPETGQWVLAGEPIGHMSGQKSPPPELYLEVRRDGRTIDPEGWLKQGA